MLGLALTLALARIGWVAVITIDDDASHRIDPLGSVILVRELRRAWPDGVPAPWPLWLLIPIPLLGLGAGLCLLQPEPDVAALAARLGVGAALTLLPLLLVPRGLALLRRGIYALPTIGPWLGGRATDWLGALIVTAVDLPLIVS